MKRYFLSQILIFMIATASYSQLDRPLRAEINVTSGFYPFALINLEKKGVLIHTAIGDANRSSQYTSQDFFFYDNFLQQKWQIRMQLPVEYAVVNQKLDGEELQLILRNQTYRNTHTPTFLMHINLFDGGYTMDTLFTLAKTPTAAGFVHRSRVWLVQVDRSECSVNTAKTGDSTLFNYDFPRFSNQEIIDVALDTISQKLYVLYADDSRRDNFFSLAIFDTVANLVHSQEIRLNAESRPVQAKLYLDKNGKLFIYGTYNLSSERPRMDINDQLTASAGLFSLSFDESKTPQLFMQNYADFDSIDMRIKIGRASCRERV